MAKDLRHLTVDQTDHSGGIIKRVRKVIDTAGILQKVLSIQVHGHLKNFKKKNLKCYFWFINIFVTWTMDMWQDF